MYPAMRIRIDKNKNDQHATGSSGRDEVIFESDDEYEGDFL